MNRRLAERVWAEERGDTGDTVVLRNQLTQAIRAARYTSPFEEQAHGLAARKEVQTTRPTERTLDMAKLASCIALVATASLTVASSALAAPAVRRQTVRCTEAIASLTHRPRTSTRVVLDRVALRGNGVVHVYYQPRFRHPLPYFAKYGMVVRSGKRSVSLSVPVSWQGRFALGWGRNGKRQVDAVRFVGCTGFSGWRAYAGGFYVRRPACVPLIIRVGALSRRVSLGIGQSCP